MVKDTWKTLKEGLGGLFLSIIGTAVFLWYFGLVKVVAVANTVTIIFNITTSIR